MTRNCAHCGQAFQPRPQVPNQTYCSSPDCQGVRKLRWQQDKLRNDPTVDPLISLLSLISPHALAMKETRPLTCY